jgi:hypothetical protein
MSNTTTSTSTSTGLREIKRYVAEHATANDMRIKATSEKGHVTTFDCIRDNFTTGDLLRAAEAMDAMGLKVELVN